MRHLKTTFILLILVSGIGLTGCSSLISLGPSGPVASIYTLEPLSRQGTPLSDAPVLFVEEPQVSGALDNLRIAVKRSPIRYEYLPQARWEERTPRLIQRHVARSLDNRTALNAVGDVNIDLPLLYRLRLDVRHFEVEAHDERSLSVKVAWVATLMDAMSSNVLASHVFSAQDNVADDSPDTMVQAFNVAMNAIVTEMAHWTEQKIADRGPRTMDSIQTNPAQ